MRKKVITTKISNSQYLTTQSAGINIGIKILMVNFANQFLAAGLQPAAALGTGFTLRVVCPKGLFYPLLSISIA